MSYVIAAPEALVAAATDLATLGSTIGAANAAAAGSTTALLTAGADEVSAAIAAYSECTARPIRHSVRGRRRSMSGSCRPWPQVWSAAWSAASSPTWSPASSAVRWGWSAFQAANPGTGE